jgi:hypothetical protein
MKKKNLWEIEGDTMLSDSLVILLKPSNEKFPFVVDSSACRF